MHTVWYMVFYTQEDNPLTGQILILLQKVQGNSNQNLKALENLLLYTLYCVLVCFYFMNCFQSSVAIPFSVRFICAIGSRWL